MIETTGWDVEQRLNKKIEEMAKELGKQKKEIARMRYIFMENILRLAPEMQHEEISRILASEPHYCPACGTKGLLASRMYSL